MHHHDPKWHLAAPPAPLRNAPPRPLKKKRSWPQRLPAGEACASKDAQRRAYSTPCSASEHSPHQLLVTDATRGAMSSCATCQSVLRAVLSITAAPITKKPSRHRHRQSAVRHGVVPWRPAMLQAVWAAQIQPFPKAVEGWHLVAWVGATRQLATCKSAKAVVNVRAASHHLHHHPKRPTKTSALARTKAATCGRSAAPTAQTAASGAPASRLPCAESCLAASARATQTGNAPDGRASSTSHHLVHLQRGRDRIQRHRHDRRRRHRHLHRQPPHRLPTCQTSRFKATRPHWTTLSPRMAILTTTVPCAS